MIAGDLKPKSTKQWVKLALVPVLAVVLLLVLWKQPKTQSESAEAVTEPALIASPSVASSSDTTHAAAQVPAPKPVWRRARLEDVIAFNPFEPEQPEELQDSEDAASEAYGGNGVTNRKGDKSRARTVNTGQLQAIFVDAQGAAAILDSQVVHVGDNLPSGGRVVEISAEGIKLEGL